MAGKDFLGRGKDVIDDFILEFDNLKKRIRYLETNRRPTVPGYNFNTDNPGDKPLDPVEGQVAVGIDDNNLWHYINGEWRRSEATLGVWTDFNLIPPWENVGLPWGPAQYNIIAGEFFFRGAVQGGTNANKLAILPSIDRPEFLRRFLVSRDFSIATLDVYPNGDIYLTS